MSGKYNTLGQALIDLDAFQVHHKHPHLCPLDEMVDLALEAFLQTTEAEVGTRSGMSSATFDRCRAAKAAAKLRANWLPSEAP